MSDTRRLHQIVPTLVLLAILTACSDKPAPAASIDASYVAVSRGRIDVEGGLLQLSMPGEGTLTKIAVQEGNHVKPGQVLAVLDTEPARLAASAAEAHLGQAKAQVELYTAQLETARTHAERLTAAADADAVDRQTADTAKGTVAQLVAELGSAHAAARLAEVNLREARYALAHRTLRAPVEATVVRIAQPVGASVSPQSGALFTLLPQRPAIVRAELNELYVGAVQPGMAATVVPDEDQTSPGMAAHVARVGVVFGPSKLGDDPALLDNARTVECILTFDKPQAQRVGQRVLVRYGTMIKPAPLK